MRAAGSDRKLFVAPALKIHAKPVDPLVQRVPAQQHLLQDPGGQNPEMRGLASWKWMPLGEVPLRRAGDATTGAIGN